SPDATADRLTGSSRRISERSASESCDPRRKTQQAWPSSPPAERESSRIRTGERSPAARNDCRSTQTYFLSFSKQLTRNGQNLFHARAARSLHKNTVKSADLIRMLFQLRRQTERIREILSFIAARLSADFSEGAMHPLHVNIPADEKIGKTGIIQIVPNLPV